MFLDGKNAGLLLNGKNGCLLDYFKDARNELVIELVNELIFALDLKRGRDGQSIFLEKVNKLDVFLAAIFYDHNNISPIPINLPHSE